MCLHPADMPNQQKISCAWNPLRRKLCKSARFLRIIPAEADPLLSTQVPSEAYNSACSGVPTGGPLQRESCERRPEFQSFLWLQRVPCPNQTLHE
jgi:hypothetical protein